MKITDLDASVQQEIQSYIGVLLKKKVPVQKVILFGSYAKQCAHEESDIDLAVITTKFSRTMHHEMGKLNVMRMNISDRIEVIALRPEMMDRHEVPLIQHIHRDGVVVYAQK